MTRLLLLALALCLAACDGDPRQRAAQRAEAAREAWEKGAEVHLGVVWNSLRPGFFDGAVLAAEELNAAGGLAGRKLVLHIVDELPRLRAERVLLADREGRYRAASQHAGAAIAREVLSNRQLAAVVGHSDIGQTSLSAMNSYAEERVLLISAGTIDAQVAWLQTGLFFQLAPGEQRQVQKLVQEARRQGWNRLKLVYFENRQSDRMIQMMRTQMAAEGISVSGTSALSSNVASSPPDLAAWVREQFNVLQSDDTDAVLLLGPATIAAEVMLQARALGVAQPFIGGPVLSYPAFIDRVGADGEGTLIANLYRDDSYQAVRFAERFRKRFPDKPADLWAALGYDSVRLYAQAVVSANSVDSTAVANVLNFRLPVWFGLVGQYAFRDGENTRMQLHTQVLARLPDGKFAFRFVDPIESTVLPSD